MKPDRTLFYLLLLLSSVFIMSGQATAGAIIIVANLAISRGKL